MSDLVTTQIFSNGETGITATKMNNIVALSAIQTSFVASKPVASSTGAGDNLLLLTSGGTYAKIDSSTFSSSIAALLPAPEPKIWAVRLRSFSSVGNPNFEVDQRNVGSAIGMYTATNTPQIDRWVSFKPVAATMTGNMQQMSASPPIVVPGTNFAITSKFWRFILLTQQTTLASTDYHNLTQFVEGPLWRELMNDVHSVSLLVRSSVANLNFGLLLKDPVTATKTLSKLCNIPTANTWTLISLPNLPIWPSGNFVSTPGANGYQLIISLASGSGGMNPANDIWQTFAATGAIGQSNFASNPVNSTFDIAFVQHEPGSQCSTLMDKPFNQNYDECLRYFTKSYDYDVALGTASAVGDVALSQQSTLSGWGTVRFPKAMAKIPVCTTYNPITGALNSTRLAGGSDYAVTGFTNLSKAGFPSITTATMPTPVAGAAVRIHYTADTGW